jgi:hypothetical protein
LKFINETKVFVVFFQQKYKIGNKFFRCVYVWEFEDKSAYVGLTYNFNKRKEDHKTDSKSPVFKKLKKCDGYCKKLTEYIDFKKSIEKEVFYIQEYKNNNWYVLNGNKGGSLGHTVFNCTVEECINIAKTCRTKAEFQKKYKRFYKYSLEVGIYDTLFEHLTYSKKDNNYWTKERCHEIALLCKNNLEFENKYNSVYVTSRKKGWYDEITKHFVELRKRNRYWTIERSIDVTKECKNKSELKKKYYQAYFVLKNNNLLDKIYDKKIKNIWSFENCKKEALKYNSRGDFQKKSKCAYSKAHKMKWLDEICSHMKLIRKITTF